MERYKWVEMDGSSMMKQFSPGYSMEMAETEVRLTRAVRDLGMEAAYPQKIVEKDGAIGILFDRVYGPNFREWMQRNPASWSKMAALFAHEHHEMHMHQFPELPSKRSIMEQRIRECPSLENELRQKVLAILKRLPEGENVCHWNFVPENVIFTINGPVVLDWQDAGKGHFLADVARTSVLLSLSVDDNLTKILQGTYITEYLKICGRPDEELDRWGVVVAADKLCDGVVEERERLLELIQRWL
jgi:hypothetical protein